MQLGEFLDAYKPNEKHRIVMTNADEFNFILPDDGKIYFISGMDFTTGSYLYDVTKLKEQLATVGKTLEDVGIWGNSNGKFYYSDTSNDLSIENKVLNDLFIKNKGRSLIDDFKNPAYIPDMLENEEERILDYFKNDCGITVTIKWFGDDSLDLSIDESTAIEGYEAVEGKEYEIYYTQEDGGYNVFLDGNLWFISNSDGYDYVNITFDVLS